MFRSLFYSLKQAFFQVFRNRAMSIASMFSITAMLLILGLFFMIIVNVNMIAQSAKSDFDTIQVYLEEDVSYDDAKDMIAEIENENFVEEASYLSKDDAMDNWKSKWGENAYLLDGLNKNPLPDSIIIKVTELDDADKLVAFLEDFDGISKVKYYKDTVDKLMSITNFIQLGALIMIGFLVFVSVIVVSNTVKLTVLAREREISIMKYIGATNWFIRAPFLIEGMIIGLISAIISVVIVSVIYIKLNELIGAEIFVMLSSSLVPAKFLIKNIIGVFLTLGITIGAVGSIISMRRFLDT